MTLFEVTNGYSGFASVRVYVWTTTEARALELAGQRFRTEKDRHGGYSDRYWTNLECRALFAADAAEFVTDPDDDGFVMESA